MKRRINILASLLCAIGANWSAWAEYFNFYALSTHPCVVQDCMGEDLSFSRYNDGSHGYYYVYNADLGATDMSVDEVGDYSQIKAIEPQGLRFKGWYTKSGDWAFDAQPEVSLATVCLETEPTISGAKIKNAARWGNGASTSRPTIVAKYVPIYGVNTSASPADAGTVSDSRIYEEGERVSLSSSAKDGYALKGWEKDGQFVSPTNFSFVAAAGCAGTYTAVFTGKVYRVDLLIQGGEGGTDIVMATYRQPMPTPIVLPHRYGYDFGGYFDQKGGAGVQYYSAKGESAHLWDKSFGGTLNAFWIPQKRPLNIRLEPGVAKVCYRFGEDLTWNETTTNATVDVVVGTVVHGYGVAAEGWEITKWRIYDGEQYMQTMGTNGLELKPEAQKETVRWTVTFADPTWTYESEQEVVEDGGAVSPPDWTRVGYELSWNPAGFEKVTANFTANAVWTPITSIVRFDANGGSGTMADQTAVYDQPLTLRANEFVNAPLFFAHWTTSVDKVEYPDGAVVSNLTTVAGATNVFYAVWEKHTFAVRFFGNGGTNTMADQSFDYGSGTKLRPNAFVRDGFTFAGWATDPTNAVACADEDDASTLTTVDGAVVPLYAKWTANGSGIDSELSAAIGCDSVNLTTNNFGWVIAPGEGKDGGNALRTNVGDFNPDDNSHKMSVLLVGKGTLRYRCKAEINASPIFQEYYEGKPSDFGFFVGEKFEEKTNVSEWAEYKYDKTSDDSETVSWAIVMRNINHKYDHATYGPCGSDDDYALIDFVRWEPAVTNAMTVGVTFRDADGGVFDNVTRAAGEVYGELPVPTDPLGRDFYGWECEGKKIDETWSVPNYADGVEVQSRWNAIPIVTNAVPTAAGGLTYTGEEQKGVPEGDGYAIVGNVGTNAGSYTAWATPLDNHVWNGGFGGATNIAWTIAKAAAPDVSGVSFTDATYEFDGTERTIAVSGTVPAGVAVVYSGDPTNRTEVGTNTVTASFRVLDETNYEAITTTLTAKLVITAKEEPPTPPDPPTPVVTNAVPVAVTGLVYDGTAKTGVPAGANYTIVGNVGTNAGNYVAVATVTNGVWEGGATGATNIAWTIAKAPDPPEPPDPPDPPEPESGRLYADPEVGEFRTDAAATYNGWLRQGETIVAAIQVKTSKGSASKPAKTSLSVTPVGGKKKTYKSTIVAKDGGFVDGFGVRYGNEELTGTVAGLPGVPDGATVEAAKDFSKSKVPAEKARMSGVPVGCRTLALPTAAGGCDCISVTIDKKGKAKVKGTLDDGTSISLSVQGALGSRSFVVPVVYSKNVSSKATGLKQLVTFAFLLWVDLSDGTAKMSDETGGRWIGDERIISQSRTVARPADGYYGIRFEAPAAYLAVSADGEPLTPDGERIAVVGKKWSADKSVGSVAYDAAVGVYVKVGNGKTPANVSKLKLSYTEKTGLVKGSFKLYYLMPPKVKADSVTVTGIAVDGVFYGNAVIKKKGLYAISWDRLQ